MKHPIKRKKAEFFSHQKIIDRSENVKKRRKNIHKKANVIVYLFFYPLQIDSWRANDFWMGGLKRIKALTVTYPLRSC